MKEDGEVELEVELRNVSLPLQSSDGPVVLDRTRQVSSIIVLSKESLFLGTSL